MDFLTPLIKPGIDLVKTGLSAARRKLGKRKYDELVSAVITELLRQHPDMTSAQARLAAIRATGVAPNADLLRAESMFEAARRHADSRVDRSGYYGPPKKIAARKKKGKPRGPVGRKRKRPSRKKA